ncbi:hypothetical protein [Rhodococcoides fascians]|uniref:hypothetical protein n=1 Tax=Rhodococcoides fascians TaxID=1828 RepID=UPI0012D2FBC7|nr:hypothetical protein [Rhodococcus fascians]
MKQRRRPPVSAVTPLRPTEARTPELRTTSASTDVAPERVSIVIGAGSGGAGATTIALGVAHTLAESLPVAAVDATSDGGDLFDRAAARPLPDTSITAAIPASSAASTGGIVLCGSASLSTNRFGDHHFGAGEFDHEPHARRADPAQSSDLMLLDSILSSRGVARVFDLGTAVDAPRAAALRRHALLVLAAPVRAQPLTRLRTVLDRLRWTHGREALAGTVVVLTHTVPGSVVDLAPIRAALTPLVAGLIEVPFDPVLAAPGLLDHRQIAPATAHALHTLSDLTLHRIASGRHPAPRRRTHTGIETDNQRRREQA